MDEKDIKGTREVDVDLNKNDSENTVTFGRVPEAVADDALAQNDDTLSQNLAKTCEINESNAENLSDSVGYLNSFEECSVKINPDCTNKLTNGLMHSVLPELEKAKSSIEETVKNQDILIETVQQENAKFAECNSMGHLVDKMHEVRVYYNKLITVKKDMIVLTERTSKLKRRAVKLQQQKQREEQYLIQRRERELEKERQLIARVVKKTDY